MTSNDQGAGQHGRDERQTVPIEEAARMLGRSTSMVRKYLQSSAHPLRGNPSPGRGRSRRQLVYVDTIAEQQNHLEAVGRSSTRRSSHMNDLQRQVEALEVEFGRLRGSGATLPPLKAQGASASENAADLVWAIQRMSVAADMLHAAADKGRDARRELLEAVDACSRAIRAQDDVEHLVRQSDRIRSEVIGVFLAPPDASGAE